MNGLGQPVPGRAGGAGDMGLQALRPFDLGAKRALIGLALAPFQGGFLVLSILAQGRKGAFDHQDQGLGFLQATGVDEANGFAQGAVQFQL